MFRLIFQRDALVEISSLNLSARDTLQMGENLSQHAKARRIKYLEKQ